MPSGSSSARFVPVHGPGRSQDFVLYARHPDCGFVELAAGMAGSRRLQGELYDSQSGEGTALRGVRGTVIWASRHDLPAVAPPARQSAARYFLGTGLVLGSLLAVVYGAMIASGLSMKGWDFLFLYTPSRLFLQGHGAHLYDYPFLSHLEATIARPVTIKHGGMPNVYPPYVAVILAPLALLPYDPAYFLWLVVNAGLLVWSLFKLETYACLSGRRALVARFATLFFVPVLLALFQGQSTTCVLAAWTACFFALRSGRDDLAGIALAASLIKPQYAIPWLLVLLLRRRWTALLWFAGSGLLLLVLSVVAFGPGVIPTYAHSLTQAAGYTHQFGGFDDIANRGFSAFFGLLLPTSLARPATLVADAAAVALLALHALNARSIERSLGLATVVALLVSPHVLIHDLALLLIPFAVMLRYEQSWRTALGVASIYLGVVAGFFLTLGIHFQFVTLPLVALALWMSFTAGSEEGAQRPDYLRLVPPVQRGAAKS